MAAKLPAQPILIASSTASVSTSGSSNNATRGNAMVTLSTSPNGTEYGTTPNGTRIRYDRSALMQLRNSPLSNTPPKFAATIPKKSQQPSSRTKAQQQPSSSSGGPAAAAAASAGAGANPKKSSGKAEEEIFEME